LARARNIKPGFFKNEDLAVLPAMTRLLFVGLWTIADREGRLENRPQRIRAEIFPYEVVDIAAGLKELQGKGFVKLYSVGGKDYAEIQNWSRHQNPHHQETESVIPASHLGEITSEVAPKLSGSYRADSLIPDSLNTDSSIAAQPKPATDSRFHPIREHVKRCCEHAKVPFVWDGGEGSHLSKWLKAAPASAYPLEVCIELVKNRFRLAREPGERPRKWIGDLGKFAGGNHGQNGIGTRQPPTSNSKAARNLAALERAIRPHQSGSGAVSHDDEPRDPRSGVAPMGGNVITLPPGRDKDSVS
jgi:hypothetical protein